MRWRVAAGALDRVLAVPAGSRDVRGQRDDPNSDDEADGALIEMTSALGSNHEHSHLGRDVRPGPAASPHPED